MLGKPVLDDINQQGGMPSLLALLTRCLDEDQFNRPSFNDIRLEMDELYEQLSEAEKEAAVILTEPPTTLAPRMTKPRRIKDFDKFDEVEEQGGFIDLSSDKSKKTNLPRSQPLDYSTVISAACTLHSSDIKEAKAINAGGFADVHSAFLLKNRDSQHAPINNQEEDDTDKADDVCTQGKLVAVKLFRSNSGWHKANFEHEVYAYAKLGRHKNILRFYGACLVRSPITLLIEVICSQNLCGG